MSEFNRPYDVLLILGLIIGFLSVGSLFIQTVNYLQVNHGNFVTAAVGLLFSVALIASFLYIERRWPR